jgi:hypothetical protein
MFSPLSISVSRHVQLLVLIVCLGLLELSDAFRLIMINYVHRQRDRGREVVQTAAFGTFESDFSARKLVILRRLGLAALSNVSGPPLAIVAGCF